MGLRPKGERASVPAEAFVLLVFFTGAFKNSLATKIYTASVKSVLRSSVI
jgi:hypothetical protein